MSRRIGIVYCERIQDASCVGCAKCYKAVNERLFAFADDDDVVVVFKTGCGDCPGLVLPRLDLQCMVLDALDVDFDALYFGTCVQKARAAMGCPMDLDRLVPLIEGKLGVPVFVGTHEL